MCYRDCECDSKRRRPRLTADLGMRAGITAWGITVCVALVMLRSRLIVAVASVPEGGGSMIDMMVGRWLQRGCASATQSAQQGGPEN